MKLIHCADLHLDSEMTTNLTQEKAKERNAELLHTFTRMVEYAAEHEVTAILISGDLFDRKNISATARHLVTDVIRANQEILFFYLRGNHDSDNFFADFDTLPENLKLFGDTWTTYEMDNVVITGVELTEENKDHIYGELELDPSRVNIVMLHGQETDNAGGDSTELIRMRALKNRGIDYLALGHVHSYREEALDARGVYCYPGCLEGRGFDECGPHGFVLLDVSEISRFWSHSFVPFASRTLETVYVDITGMYTSHEIAGKMNMQLFKENISERSLVKIVLTGEVDVECEKNPEYLRKCVESDYYFVKIEDQTTLSVDYRTFLLDESLKGEFVRRTMYSDIPEEDRIPVIRYGLQLLAGEEVQE